MPMIMLAILRRLKNSEDGTVIVLAAAAMVAMLGMLALVLDGGALYLERGRLVNACDAAALASSYELPLQPEVEAKARQYLNLNGVSDQESTVSISPDGRRVTVEASRGVDYRFAQVMGISSGTASARSVAEFGAVTSATGIVPFGIPDQTLVYNQEYQLKAGSSDDYGPGNYGALALDLRGSSNYENYLKHGYSGTISVGQWISTEPGNMSGPTQAGVNYRLAQCPHTPRCSVDSYHPNCSRIMLVPVYSTASLQGRDEVLIVGFAVFLLSGVGGSGNENDVSGYFLRMAPPDGTGITVGGDQTDYGLHAARLVE